MTRQRTRDIIDVPPIPLWLDPEIIKLSQQETPIMFREPSSNLRIEHLREAMEQANREMEKIFDRSVIPRGIIFKTELKATFKSNNQLLKEQYYEEERDEKKSKT